MLLKPFSCLSLLIAYKILQTYRQTERIENFIFLCTSLSLTFSEGYNWPLDSIDIILLKDLTFLALLYYIYKLYKHKEIHTELKKSLSFATGHPLFLKMGIKEQLYKIDTL